MTRHECYDCKWLHTIIDSSNRPIQLCVFDQSEKYLQEVGDCTEGCELDGLAEALWKEANGDEM